MQLTSKRDISVIREGKKVSKKIESITLERRHFYDFTSISQPKTVARRCSVKKRI